MIALLSFIVVIIGAINWFCIGLLQFDFVAGLFGSQSSIFSRLVYIVVGLGALMLLFNLIENKGKIAFNFKKKKKKEDNQSIQSNNTFYTEAKTSANTEAGQDHFEQKNSTNAEQKDKSEHCSNESCPIDITEDTKTHNHQNQEKNN